MSSSDCSDSSSLCKFDAPALRAWLRSKATFCVSLAGGKMRPAIRWLCLFIGFLRETCDGLIIKESETADPVCSTYMSHGWTAWVTEPCIFTVGELRVRRNGKVRKEFSAERTIIKRIGSTHRAHDAILLTPARPLEQGKGFWNTLAASRAHHATPRAAGHTGCVGSVYIQDGLHSDNFF